jgi:AcrR family transcriptional regulator
LEKILREENRALRQQQIEFAAYALLEEKGYSGTSMLSIAKHARASNETLYNWYGDKLGLFRSLVERNAENARMLLEDHLKSNSDPLTTLEELSPVLLSLLVSHRAIALNRAAAADPTGELGKTLSEAGRETILPLVAKVFENSRKEGILNFRNTNDAVELYLGLLVGDLQIRRVIGACKELSPAAVRTRADRALQQLKLLLNTT